MTPRPFPALPFGVAAAASLGAAAAFVLLPLLSSDGADLFLRDLATSATGYERFLAVGPVAGLAVAAAGLGVRAARPSGLSGSWGASAAVLGAAVSAAAVSGLGAFLAARALEPGPSALEPGIGLLVAAPGAALALVASIFAAANGRPWRTLALAACPLAAMALGPWVPAGIHDGRFLDEATVAVLGTFEPAAARYAAAARLALALAVAAAWTPPLGARAERWRRPSLAASLATALGCGLGLAVSIHRLGAFPTGAAVILLPIAALTMMAIDARRTTSASNPTVPTGDP